MVSTLTKDTKDTLKESRPIQQPPQQPQGAGMVFKDIASWRQHVINNWAGLKQQADKLPLASPYERLIAITLLPALPKNKTELRTFLRVVAKMRFGVSLSERFKTIFSGNSFDHDLPRIIQTDLNTKSLSVAEQEGLDWLLLATGALAGATANSKKAPAFAREVLNSLKDNVRGSSAIRVQAGMLSAGQNLVIAGQDVNIVTQYYQGDKARLRSYLSGLRAEWNIPDLSHILPGYSHQPTGTIRLHKLYTPVDVWTGGKYDTKEIMAVANLRFRSIEQDMTDSRQPVLEAIATHPLVVITGGPGTGKSSLCRFIATSLAYACDPRAEKSDKVSGLQLLGPAWIHGAILPLYVGLRNFCADKDVFPDKLEKGKAQCLLDYLRKTTDSFATELERYLTNDDAPTHGTLLILDGLDEVYHEKDRLILKRIIENWAARFPMCRILVTTRTYAYRQSAKWRLSNRFASAELAPFTWRQMQNYIEAWYEQAATSRPANFGGRVAAQSHAQLLSKDLLNTIVDTESLWPLARQPLMLALLTLIHEDNKRLPGKKAELYEQTVELLDRWNIPSPADQLAEKLSSINLDRVRAALKLIAFDLQKQQIQYQKYPATIHRKELLERFMQQQAQGAGLGAPIENVLEYLSTRNGILVSDKPDVYRFPHLSIQEYLAACALIEQYDECPMPDNIKPQTPDGWLFPTNIAHLLKSDPFRWRNVTLFAGSIIATNKGQDRRWDLIEELLPDEITNPVADDMVHSISIASEIWLESWLKARTRLQRAVQTHLIECLRAVQYDDRLDAPERAQTRSILGRLETGL